MESFIFRLSQTSTKINPKVLHHHKIFSHFKIERTKTTLSAMSKGPGPKCHLSCPPPAPMLLRVAQATNSKPFQHLRVTLGPAGLTDRSQALGTAMFSLLLLLREKLPVS